MTRKHFQLIADAIALHRRGRGPEAVEALDSLALLLAHDLAATNPLFDRGRFLAACKSERIAA